MMSIKEGMDKIKKLLKRASVSDRIRILSVIDQIIINELEGLDIKKIKRGRSFRARVGWYRIFFHQDAVSGKNVIDAVKRRNDNTY